MLIVGFQGDNFDGSIMKELQRLKEHDIVRLDRPDVREEERGGRARDRAAERPRRGGGGAVRRDRRRARRLRRRGRGRGRVRRGRGAAELEDGHVFDDDAVWYLGDAIPEGTAAAVALLEHRWAIPLRDKIAQAGGLTLSDAWIHVADLVAVGASRGAKAESLKAQAAARGVMPHAAAWVFARLEHDQTVAAREGVRRAGHRLDGDAPAPLGIGKSVAGEDHQVRVALVDPERGLRRARRGPGRPLLARGR